MTKNINNGVSCQVTNCTHYCNGGKCKAEKISVDTATTNYGGNPSAASNRTETCCQTFKAQ